MRARGREPLRFILYLSLVWLLAGCLPSTPAPPSFTPIIIASPAATMTAEPTASPEPTRQIGDTYFPNIENPVPFTFAGQVIRGDTFQQQINRYLLFCLTPNSVTDATGWTIYIVAYMDMGCDNATHTYNGIVSPPFYGVNPILIEGWHFRNEDNSGPNDGSVNAPQETRWFQFVLSEEDYQVVWPAHLCSFRNMCDNLSPAEAENIIWAIPKARGTLTITDLVLGNLGVGEQAWIESMSFTVELLLPEGFVAD